MINLQVNHLTHLTVNEKVGTDEHIVHQFIITDFAQRRRQLNDTQFEIWRQNLKAKITSSLHAFSGGKPLNMRLKRGDFGVFGEQQYIEVTVQQ